MRVEYRYFEDIVLDGVFESPFGRTITQQDIVGFDGLAGDHSPLHVDHEYMKTSPFGSPIAHGFLGIAVQAGLVIQTLGRPPVASAGIVRLTWTWASPTREGDTLRVRCRVSTKTEENAEYGLVTWAREIVNQRGDVIQTGEIVERVRRRP